MNNAQKYEMAIMRLHCEPTIGLNPEYRKGLSKAHSIAHDKWCRENPNVTREERKKAYKESYEKLCPLYPSVAELS